MIEFIILVVAFTAGWYVREWYAMRIVNKLTQDMSEKIVDEFKKNVINITVEEQDGVLYIYSKEGTFLAQGKTMQELEEILEKKFPGKFFNASPEDLKIIESH